MWLMPSGKQRKFQQLVRALFIPIQNWSTALTEGAGPVH